MIITECGYCNEPYFYPYEAGDDPCGRGVFGKWTCDKCGKNNYTERTAFNGLTYPEDKFLEMNPRKLEIN
jgi:hypothetical protein